MRVFVEKSVLVSFLHRKVGFRLTPPARNGRFRVEVYGKSGFYDLLLQTSGEFLSKYGEGVVFQ